MLAGQAVFAAKVCRPVNLDLRGLSPAIVDHDSFDIRFESGVIGPPLGLR